MSGATSAESLSIHSGQHASVAFYNGARPVRVRMPPSPSDVRNAPVETRSMYVMELHQSLLPPASISLITAENEEHYARHLATDSGLELLRINWELLLPLLLPTVDLTSELTRQSSASTEVHTTNTSRAQPTTQNTTRSIASESVDVALSTHCIEHVTECRQPIVRACDVRALRAPSVMDRIHYSYIVFLRFFGWRMHDDRRGVLDRHRGWRMRYDALTITAHAARSAALVRDERDLHELQRNACDDDDGCASSCLSEVFATAARSSCVISAPSTMGSNTLNGVFDFYIDALPHMLRSLLDLGFITYSIRFVEFLLEELACERLTFLYTLVEQTLVPQMCSHNSSENGVDESHKRRLKRMLRRLTCSDSED